MTREFEKKVRETRKEELGEIPQKKKIIREFTSA